MLVMVLLSHKTEVRHLQVDDAIEYFNFMTGLIKDYIKTLK
jgi:hypothetical protein